MPIINFILFFVCFFAWQHKKCRPAVVNKGQAGQGRAGQGRAGQGRAGQGRAGQGRAGQGRAGQGRAVVNENDCTIHHSHICLALKLKFK